MPQFWSTNLAWPWLCLALLPALLILPAIVWRGRRLSYLASLCAVLILTLAALWIRNSSARESLDVTSVEPASKSCAHSLFGLGSCRDGIFVGKTRWIDDDPTPNTPSIPSPGLEWHRYALSPATPPYSQFPSRFRRWGFQLVDDHDPVRPDRIAPGYVYAIRLPAWFLMALLSTPILIKLRLTLHRRTTRRWQRAGRCARCGYDLTGTPANPNSTKRCSECGTVNPAPHH